MADHAEHPGRIDTAVFGDGAAIVGGSNLAKAGELKKVVAPGPGGKQPKGPEEHQPLSDSKGPCPGKDRRGAQGLGKRQHRHQAGQGQNIVADADIPVSVAQSFPKKPVNGAADEQAVKKAPGGPSQGQQPIWNHEVPRQQCLRGLRFRQST